MTSAPPKVLVIDDSHSIRTLIDRILKVHGYEVLLAGSALEGLKLAEEQNPELVICDVHMPEYDGFYVLEQLRQDQRFQVLPFIFVSGEAVERHEIRKGMSSGADDYLLKPFTANELVEAVQTRLKRYAIYASYIKSAPVQVLYSYQRLEADLQAKLLQGLQPSIFTLDIDRFKRLNDALGFHSADQLLKLLMQRFEEIKDFQITIYHGQHTAQVIILSPFLDEDETASLARQLLGIISEPLNFQGYQLHLTCSIGVYKTDNQTSLEEALKKAYIAMNQAKQQGGNIYMVYQQDMHTTVTRQLTWENELHQALSHKWFILHYQPQLDLISGEITGVEALIRLQHPVLGLIYPGEFIQIAEESGLIAAVGDWCLRESCRQVKHWHQQGFPLKVSVNVSVLQFKQGRLVQRVAEVLNEYQLSGEFLEIELTESALVRDLQAIQNDLEKLREMGVSLAIDDFGTGYSSLSYLSHLPFDLLKIDQSFIRGMADNSASLAIPKAIIDMGHSLGLEILAEGIETQEQMLLLTAYGCDLGQGYYLSKPLPSLEIEALMLKRQSEESEDS